MIDFDPRDRREVGIMVGALAFGAVACFVLAVYTLTIPGETFAAALSALGGLTIVVGLALSFGPFKRF